MKIQRLVASKIYRTRMELDLDGSEQHDWELAGKFLQSIGKKNFNDNDIYTWYVQLDENLV